MTAGHLFILHSFYHFLPATHPVLCLSSILYCGVKLRLYDKVCIDRQANSTSHGIPFFSGIPPSICPCYFVFRNKFIIHIEARTNLKAHISIHSYSAAVAAGPLSSPGVPLPDNVSNYSWPIPRHSKARRDIKITPVCSRSTPGPPTSWTCQKDLQRRALRKHSNQMCEPPQLVHFDRKE